MIHLILGQQGSGKTIFMVMKAYENYKKGKNIYSNLKLNFKNIVLDYNDIVDCKLENGCVFIDEIHLLLSARNSMSKTSRKICDSFLSMVRKKNLDVYGTTQTMRKVDIRFREEADYIYVCERYYLRNRHWIKVLHNQNLDYETPVMIKVECTESFSGKQVQFHFLANKLYKLYDTFEIVKVKGLDV